jgi:hypothetical protein
MSLYAVHPKQIINKSPGALLVSSNTEKSKCMFMSLEEKAEKNCNIKTANKCFYIFMAHEENVEQITTWVVNTLKIRHS